MPPITPEILPRAMLFDMDGTLTEPLLDFPRIKADMGIGNGPILEALAAMDPAARTVAEATLHRHEDDAAGRSTLNPGCLELLAALAARGIASAIITRNSGRSVQTVLAAPPAGDLRAGDSGKTPRPSPTPSRFISPADG